VVPYDHIDTGSALIQMWSYVGATKCRAIVAIGATAGLSVAMFGSMFPMPRVSFRCFSSHKLEGFLVNSISKYMNAAGIFHDASNKLDKLQPAAFELPFVVSENSIFPLPTN
jgi:hypothetical protein